MAPQAGADAFVVVLIRRRQRRVRMDAAHELRHALRGCGHVHSWTDAEAERRAYAFASSLLIPPSQLRAAFEGKSFLKLIQFKEKLASR